MNLEKSSFQAWSSVTVKAARQFIFMQQMFLHICLEHREHKNFWSVPERVERGISIFLACSFQSAHVQLSLRISFNQKVANNRAEKMEVIPIFPNCISAPSWSTNTWKAACLFETFTLSLAFSGVVPKPFVDL